MFPVNASREKIVSLISKIRHAKYANKCTVLSDEEDKVEIPKNLLTKHNTASLQANNGQIYDKKPFKVWLSKDKTYMWCLCGQGHGQPFCDGTHRWPAMRIKLKPVRFQVAETKHYWLCNCKQTKNRPFCDGTHKEAFVQEACQHK